MYMLVRPFPEVSGSLAVHWYLNFRHSQDKLSPSICHAIELFKGVRLWYRWVHVLYKLLVTLST